MLRPSHRSQSEARAPVVKQEERVELTVLLGPSVRLASLPRLLWEARQPNGRVQPLCGAQRSKVGCNPLLGGGL